MIEDELKLEELSSEELSTEDKEFDELLIKIYKEEEEIFIELNGEMSVGIEPFNKKINRYTARLIMNSPFSYERAFFEIENILNMIKWWIKKNIQKKGILPEDTDFSP
jgi:hypothetical protein